MYTSGNRLDMIYISHRGNLTGPNPELENSPDYIDAAIANGFDVEVDLWLVDGMPFLGHDGPQYKITLDYLFDRFSELWVHCKDGWAFDFCLENEVHCFFHNADDYTLTNRQWIWAYPGKEINTEACICVMPEWFFAVPSDKTKYGGICSDYIKNIRDTHNV